jgi:type III pantothenate kinase
LNLAIDIGNTRTKLGIFQNDELVLKETWDSLELTKLKEWLYNHPVEKIILSTVANINEEINDYFNSHFYYIQLTEKTSLPVKNLYETPETLGKDRLAAVAGAFELFPSQNCLVIDAGTCITLDLLNEEGEYLGGNITPGIEMRFKAMHHFTARLPLVERKMQKNWIGKSTETAMRNGGQLGTILEVKAFIRMCRRKYKGLNVILTGGDADFFAKNLKTKIFANQNLVLIGLNKILKHNVQLLE